VLGRFSYAERHPKTFTDKDVQALFDATPKQTFRRRAISTGMGGKRPPYRSRLRNGRNPLHKRHA
jgi:hypothetical protein